jgi:hypothetical protein
MEEPVVDGASKVVYKNGLFCPVFGDQLVVFKRMVDPQYDKLQTHTRNVQQSAFCVHLAYTYNSLLTDPKQHLHFSDGVIVELMPDPIGILYPNAQSPLRRMSAQALFWHVERQIKGKFEKLVSNQCFVLPLTSRMSKRLKEDRKNFSSFAHFSYVHSAGKLTVLDLQGSGGFLTDPEIITPDGDETFEFGKGNVGAQSISVFFLKSMSAIWCVVCSRFLTSVQRLELFSKRHSRRGAMSTHLHQENWFRSRIRTRAKRPTAASRPRNKTAIHVSSQSTTRRRRVRRRWMMARVI